jgi:phospholipid/cholesterol/gamma-HCH transport system substrate-binding protein
MAATTSRQAAKTRTWPPGNWRDGKRGPLISGRRGWIAAIVAICFVVAAGITGAVISLSGPGSATYTAYFNQAVGVYPGSGVDVLGVRVGTIDSITPEGKLVKVVMSVNNGVPVPAAVDAVIIVPSVIADRYVQLSPPYTGGAQLGDNGVIPAGRTATPVEIDQLYAAITKFSADLGPQGVNKNGALSNVITVGAANLKGNGRAFGTMIRDLSQLYQTLQNSQGNFFGTIDNLEQFTHMLNVNGGQVAEMETQLAHVSAFLAADRTELAAAISQLGTALDEVQSFVQQNQAALKTNITRLEAITQLLANEKDSLAEALEDLPLAGDNLLNAYDPSTGRFDGRGDLNEISLGTCSYITNPYQKGCPSGTSSSLTLPLPVNGGQG